MEKRFDEWNKLKKFTHSQEKTVLYCKREIWWLILGVNVGYEQDGTGHDFERPVLVLKGFSRFACLVVPLTTSRKKNKYHVDIGTIDGKRACVIISQIRLVDTRRFVNKLCTLDEGTFGHVVTAIKTMF
ncbi:MAG: type II toxin-antitoxin system PemK/MazF family toxin [Patescibacteria group bacterium]